PALTRAEMAIGCPRALQTTPENERCRRFSPSPDRILLWSRARARRWGPKPRRARDGSRGSGDFRRASAPETRERSRTGERVGAFDSLEGTEMMDVETLASTTYSRVPGARLAGVVDMATGMFLAIEAGDQQQQQELDMLAV